MDALILPCCTPCHAMQGHLCLTCHAMPQGDSVAAMDSYMKLMAKKEAEREAQEQEEEAERKRQQPLLNETSFDRRKVR